LFDSIIAFSVRNKLLIGVGILIWLVWGLWSLSRLNLDALPDITNNQVQVITTAPNLAPTEMEQYITYPLEIALAGIPKVQKIRSISRFGLSVVTIVFEDEVSIYLARQQVGERLVQVANQLPAQPYLAPVTTGLGEIFQYTLQVKDGYQHRYDTQELRTIQDWFIKRQLLGTEGVADVSSFGGYVKQYEVAITPDKLKQYNLTFTDLMHALETNNENTGGAYIEKGHSLYYIRGLGLLKSLEEIAQVPIPHRTINGVPLRVGQVAQVRFGSAVRYGALTHNGNGEAVGGIVLMLKGENSRNVIARVKERMAQIEKTLPEGISVKPYLDRSVLLGKSLNTVRNNLLEGGLIVIFILVLLLGNFRAGLVVSSVIPLALLFAIGMMNLTGVSGNLMSLGAIDFGLVVDGAVIIVESIVHRMHLSGLFRDRRKPSREDFDNLVITQSQKIRKSAAFGELIILIVYLPILTLAGIEGKMFRPMAETVSYAIIGALILSLTYVPMMSALMLNHSVSHKKSFADRLMDWLQRLYVPALKFAFRKATLIFGVAGLALVASLLVFNRLGGEFIPQLDEGDFAVEVAFQPGTSLSEVIQTSSRLEKELMQTFPEIEQIVGKIGTAEIPTDPMPIERMDMMIILKDRKEWKDDLSPEALASRMQTIFEKYPGVGSSFQQPIQMRFNELMTGAKTDIAIQIFGENLDTLASLGEKTLKIVRNVAGAEDAYVENVTGLPQINVAYRPERLAQYGLTRQELNRILSASFAGQTVGSIYEGEKRFDLVVRLAPENRLSPTQIGELYVPLPSGGQVPFSDVARIEITEGPGQISRERTRRRITIGLNVRDRDIESVIGDIESLLEKELRLPAGYSVHYGGEFENLAHAKARLAIAVPVALVLILGLLYFSLGNVGETLLIFTAIPFSAVGGIGALWLRDMPFSISAGVGFIALFGVAVLNGLVLIGYFHELKSIGYVDTLRRTITGSSERLRPVMMTALVASLGFLPMALSTAPGAEVQRPLATVVIGGLITATLLTLFLLPLLYYRFKK
jgi:cobalt-zinc-cadmium resistance protein CzcA